MKKDAREVSPQAERLYAAAKELKNIEGKSAVAKLMNVSPQMVNHWEGGRPISFEALITAQEKIGCDAIWLRDGTGDMTRGRVPDTPNLNAEQLTQLITAYLGSNDTGRRQILILATDVSRNNAASSASAANDHR